MHIEIINSIRNAVGKDYLLAMRLGACDYMKGGITLQDSIEAAKILEQVGFNRSRTCNIEKFFVGKNTILSI